ncbi:hypothetical protein ACU4GD_14985 [Cupriavidus basilensis]
MAGSERSAAARRHSRIRMCGMILVYRYCGVEVAQRPAQQAEPEGGELRLELLQ